MGYVLPDRDTRNLTLSQCSSHSIVQIKVVRKVEGVPTNKATINVVDLAGELVLLWKVGPLTTKLGLQVPNGLLLSRATTLRGTRNPSTVCHLVFAF